MHEGRPQARDGVDSSRVDAATYERRKDGIFRDGRRVFARSALSNSHEASALEGTPWTFLYQSLYAPSGGGGAFYGFDLRLTHEAAGKLVFHVYVTEPFTQVRFATLSFPEMRTEGTRNGLYEAGELVAELVPSWRDTDMDAGILARVETILPAPVSDAAALLLFCLETMPYTDIRSNLTLPLGI